MRDNYFDSRASASVPNQTKPPTGTGTGSEDPRYRGRVSDSHLTRVIRRTDLRTQNGGQRHHHHQQQRPPRFSNLQEKDFSSQIFQEKPEKKFNEEVSRNVSGQMMDGREEDSNDDDGGEWMEVKGRRSIKDETKKNSSSSSSGHPRSSPTFTSGRKKTPEPPQNHFPKRRSPDLQNQRRSSPDLQNYSQRKSKSPPVPSMNGKIINQRGPHKGQRKYERRGSSSSQEGSEDLLKDQSAIAGNNSENAKTIDLSHEDLLKRIPNMMMVSDLPDERIARSKKFTRILSEKEMLLKTNEETLLLQEEILKFLQKSWKEISTDTKIYYYNCM